MNCNTCWCLCSTSPRPRFIEQTQLTAKTKDYDRERCGCGDDDVNAIVTIVTMVLSKGDDCWMEVFSFMPWHLKRFSIENLWYLYIAHAGRVPRKVFPSIAHAQLPGVADSPWTHHPTFNFQLANTRHEGWVDRVFVPSISMKYPDICPRGVRVNRVSRTGDYVSEVWRSPK